MIFLKAAGLKRSMRGTRGGFTLASHLLATRDIRAEMKKAMGEVLESTTIEDLVQRQREKEKSEAVMYYI